MVTRAVLSSHWRLLLLLLGLVFNPSLSLAIESNVESEAAGNEKEKVSRSGANVDPDLHGGFVSALCCSLLSALSVVGQSIHRSILVVRGGKQEEKSRVPCSHHNNTYLLTH